MEYFLGAIVAILSGIAIQKLTRFAYEEDQKLMKIAFSQSHKHEMLRDYIPINIQHRILNTQSTRHFRSTRVRIMFMDNKAYWIKDNAVYVADIINGNIEKDNAKVLDIMSMDDVQLKKIEFIVDRLTEGLANDSGYPGNK